MLKRFYRWFTERQSSEGGSKEASGLSGLFRRSTITKENQEKEQKQGSPEAREAQEKPTYIKDIALGGEVYRLEKKIGGGTYGRVYRARRQRGNLLVAVKEFDVNHAEVAVRFHRESSILREVNHPNIVKVYQTGMVDLTGFLVMEYLDGWSLGKIMRKRETKKLTLPLTTFIGIIRQMTHALCVLDEKGAVHRDIKPDNILISPTGVAKLIDFGLLKAPGPSATLPDYILGTPNYISPEQVLGDKITIQVDIYSLGATFYHMVTGKVPFEGDSPQEVMKKHVKSKPIPPNTLDPVIPKKLSKLILKMLEKKPGKRPTPQKLLEAINELIDHLKALKTKQKNNEPRGWT